MAAAGLFDLVTTQNPVKGSLHSSHPPIGARSSHHVVKVITDDMTSTSGYRGNKATGST